MLPPLFGVSWGMYAVVAAVVVLLILLLVLMARRKKSEGLSTQAKSATTKTKGKGAKGAPKSPPTRADKATEYARRRQAGGPAPLAPLEQDPYAAGVAGATPELSQSPLPPAGYAPYAPQTTPPGLPIAPAPRADSVRFEDILPGSDPLQAMVVEVLSGWGDLTQEDTNRLGVFRPERVMAAVATAEIPRELKNNEHARARLAQLRRWASGLEHTVARQAAVAAIPVPEYAGIVPVQQPMPAPLAPAYPAPAPAPVAPAFSYAPGPAPVAPAPAFAPAPATPAPGVPTSEPFNIPPAPTPEMVPQPALPVSSAIPLSRTPWQSDFADAGKSTEAAIAAAAAAFWARPELGNTLSEAPSPPTPAPPQTAPFARVQVMPKAPAFPPLGQELPTLTESAPVAEAPRAVPLQPAARPAPFGGLDSDTFLQDLGSGVSTAEALLAVPAAEQAGLLAFLKPAELAKVLQLTSDSELKKAVIDTLESVGSPSALDIIYRCLDDPDPEIQAKALAAADRLLGAQ